MQFDFTGKVVLITGGTRGIGKQLANDFKDLGADLILTGTDSNKISDLNKGGFAKYFCVDFLNKESVIEFIEKLNEYSKIDVCVNNAGINRIDYLWDIKEQDWDDLLCVNLKAPFIVSQAVAKLMKKNNCGKIINISSIAGVVSRDKRGVYTSSKAGLIGLTRAMAVELAPYGILVNSVSPGFTWTDLTESMVTKEEVDLLSSRVPLGRFATPDEISKVVLFLASELNTFIVGQNIIVDGGYVSV